MSKYLIPIFLCFFSLMGQEKDMPYSLQKMVKEAVELKRFCYNYKTDARNRYAKWYQQEQARKTIATNLQYLLLKETILEISTLSKNLGALKADYQILSENLVDQSCSPNITMMNHQKIKDMFNESYSQEMSLPKDLEGERLKEKLALSVNRFKQICSWGGKTDNYRLLSWYLSDHFIYSWLLNTINKQEKVVICREEVCDIKTKKYFEKEYPLAAGSQDFQEDWKKMYCHHFKEAIHDTRDEPEIILKWINRFFPKRVFYFADLVENLTGRKLVLDNNNSLDWNTLLLSYTSQIEKDWKDKALKSLVSKVGKVQHEEPLLLIPIEEKYDPDKIIDKNLDIEVMVTAGEFDRYLDKENKLSVEFSLDFPKSFFSWTKRNFEEFSPKEKIEYANLRKKLLQYFKKSLSLKHYLFSKAPWEEQLPELLVDEVSQKLLNAKLKGFAGGATSHQWNKINVKLYYGIFALKHLYEMGLESGRTYEGIKFNRD